jgi:hypothetical protein
MHHVHAHQQHILLQPVTRLDPLPRSPVCALCVLCRWFSVICVVAAVSCWELSNDSVDRGDCLADQVCFPKLLDTSATSLARGPLPPSLRVSPFPNHCCRLLGEAAAGIEGDPSAVVLVNRLEAGALTSIAGRPAAAEASPSRSDQLMLMLEPGATAAVYTVSGLKVWCECVCGGGPQQGGQQQQHRRHNIVNNGC